MKSLFEKLGGTYHKEGDYYLPNLVAPDAPVLGIWGQQRRRFLKDHRHSIYIGMLLSGTLNDHLTETDRSAEELFDRLCRQMAEAERINEELKASNQMEWVGRMNNICSRATEIVNKELIFV